MRIPHREQLQLDCPPVSQVALNLDCRDRIIPILRALQHIYSRSEILQPALGLIANDVLGDADPDLGREGMTLWQIFVLAAIRQGCQFTYDHLQDLAENHRVLQQMMQVGDWEQATFNWRKIRDNVCHVQPQTIEKINHLVIQEGHRLVPEAAEAIRGDSFVVETNIHYPTESRLILDGLKKILTLAPQLATLLDQIGWRQSGSLWKKAKRAGREIDRIKKGAHHEERLQAAYGKLFHITDLVLPRVQTLLEEALGSLPNNAEGCLPATEASQLYQDLIYWQAVTEHVCGTAWRRVMEGVQVPNSEKLFSLFEPHTELIKRGKMAQPVQWGHKLLVMEDAAGFICHYKIVPLRAEERDLLIPEMKVLQARLLGRIRRASFDRGFHSPSNQEELARIVPHPCVPMPGRHQSAEQESTATIEFRQARQHHPGIESAIGALQSGNGLERCRDHSYVGYERYIGLGILGRNLLVLGKLLLAREHPNCEAAHSLRGQQAA